MCLFYQIDSTQCLNCSNFVLNIYNKLCCNRYWHRRRTEEQKKSLIWFSFFRNLPWHRLLWVTFWCFWILTKILLINTKDDCWLWIDILSLNLIPNRNFPFFVCFFSFGFYFVCISLMIFSYFNNYWGEYLSL